MRKNCDYSSSWHSRADFTSEVIAGATMGGRMDKVSAGKAISCCASCGAAEGNEIELNKCEGCDIARHCSDECQGEHKLLI